MNIFISPARVFWTKAFQCGLGRSSGDAYLTPASNLGTSSCLHSYLQRQHWPEPPEQGLILHAKSGILSSERLSPTIVQLI